MSNFRTIDRQTGFLSPPSVDEWLPEKHRRGWWWKWSTASIVRDQWLIVALDRRGIIQVAARHLGLWLCDGRVFDGKLERASNTGRRPDVGAGENGGGP